MLHLTLTATLHRGAACAPRRTACDSLTPLARVSRRLCGLHRADGAARQSWSERNRRPGRAACSSAVRDSPPPSRRLVWAQPDFDALLAALVLYFGAFNFLEARLPAALTVSRRRGVARSGARRLRDLPVRGRVCREPAGRGPARKSLERHGNLRLCGGGGRRLAALGCGIRIAANPARLTVGATAGGRLQ